MTELPPRVALSASILLLGLGLPAQSAYIVDASGGAGSHFTDLPAAFAQVADGDKLIVRTGKYRGGVLNKAITLIGEPGAYCDIGTQPLRVTGIAKGKTCVLQGLSFYGGSLTAPGVDLDGNQGLIVVADLQCLLTTSRVGLRVNRCDAVQMNRCLVQPSLSIEQSEVSATACIAGPVPGGVVTVGIFLSQSRLELSQSMVYGHTGYGHAPDTPGIRAHSSAIRVRGDAAALIQGGSFYSVMPAIEGSGTSTLVYDPAVRLVGGLKGMQAANARRMPALWSRNAPALGSNFELELVSAAGAPFVLGVALPSAPFDLPFGRQWIDLNTELFLVIAMQNAGGRSLHRYPVPQQASLRGLSLGFQAAAGAGAALELSNAVAVVLH